MAKKPTEVVSAGTERKLRNLKPFQPGQSGNPKGRPPGSRNKLQEDMLADMCAAWEKHGPKAIELVATSSPADFLKICAQLLPRQLAVDATVSTNKYVIAPNKMSDPEWKAFLEWKQQTLPVKQASVKQTNGNGTTH